MLNNIGNMGKEIPYHIYPKKIEPISQQHGNGLKLT